MIPGMFPVSSAKMQLSIERWGEERQKPSLPVGQSNAAAARQATAASIVTTLADGVRRGAPPLLVVLLLPLPPLELAGAV